MSKYKGLFGRIRTTMSASDIDLAFVLDFVYSREKEGLTTRITDLVQKLEFGTGPTVFRKVGDLVQKGYLESAPAPNDARAKILVLTAGGHKWLQQLEQKVA